MTEYKCEGKQVLTKISDIFVQKHWEHDPRQVYARPLKGATHNSLTCIDNLACLPVFRPQGTRPRTGIGIAFVSLIQSSSLSLLFSDFSSSSHCSLHNLAHHDDHNPGDNRSVSWSLVEVFPVTDESDPATFFLRSTMRVFGGFVSDLDVWPV